MSETIIICFDNSEFSRNQDYKPSRFQIQYEIASLYSLIKTEENFENTIGLLDINRKIHLVPTNNINIIQKELDNMKIQEGYDVFKNVYLSQLLFKYRPNKKLKCRIILFICSPINDIYVDIENLGKMLKKNNINIDVISLGEIEVNHDKLEELVNYCNNNNTSHLLEIDNKLELNDILLKL
jgi:26S proteasome regulatory subunit N10